MTSSLFTKHPSRTGSWIESAKDTRHYVTKIRSRFRDYLSSLGSICKYILWKMTELKRLPVFVFPSSLNFFAEESSSHKQMVTVYNPYDFVVNFKGKLRTRNVFISWHMAGTILTSFGFYSVVQCTTQVPDCWSRRIHQTTLLCGYSYPSYFCIAYLLSCYRQIQDSNEWSC